MRQSGVMSMKCMVVVVCRSRIAVIVGRLAGIGGEKTTRVCNKVVFRSNWYPFWSYLSSLLYPPLLLPSHLTLVVSLTVVVEQRSVGAVRVVAITAFLIYIYPLAYRIWEWGGERRNAWEEREGMREREHILYLWRVVSPYHHPIQGMEQMKEPSILQVCRVFVN